MTHIKIDAETGRAGRLLARIMILVGIGAGLCFAGLTASGWAAEAVAPAKPAVHPYPLGDEGDIWLLAGQSNCFGFSPMIRPIEPDSRIQAYLSNHGAWFVAKESMGLMPNPPTRPTKEGTVGWHLMFAKDLIKITNRPIGLIRVGPNSDILKLKAPEANGGKKEPPAPFTSIKQYGAVIPVALEGGGRGKLKGFIWYQGESDALIYPSAAPDYEKNLTSFIKQVREETENPDLPVIVVQLDRLAGDVVLGQPATTSSGEKLKDGFASNTLCWEQVREAQRRVADKLPNVYVLSTGDLNQMADPIHIGFDSHEHLAARLAELAASQVYKIPGHGTPIKLESVKIESTRHGATGEILKDMTTIRVRFSGVTGRLRAVGPASGFSLRSGRADDKATPIYLLNLHPGIYSAEFDPNDLNVVLLRICGGAAWFQSYYQPSLYYGAGLNPLCTITDEKDIPLPAFGPIAVPPPAE